MFRRTLIAGAIGVLVGSQVVGLIFGLAGVPGATRVWGIGRALLGVPLGMIVFGGIAMLFSAVPALLVTTAIYPVVAAVLRRSPGIGWLGLTTVVTLSTVAVLAVVSAVTKADTIALLLLFSPLASVPAGIALHLLRRRAPPHAT